MNSKNINENIFKNYGKKVAYQLARNSMIAGNPEYFSRMDELFEMLEDIISPEREKLFVEFCLNGKVSSLLKAA